MGDQTPAVLVVDDRPENLLVLSSILEPLDLDIVEAGSGADALRNVLERDFACVLLDVQMPEMDGFEVARHIKGRPRTRHMPILFVTAIDPDPARVHEAYALGAVDFLSKPLDPDVVRARVRAFVEVDAKARQIERQAAELREAELREIELRHRAELAEAEARATAELRRTNEALARRTAQAEMLARDLERANSLLRDAVAAAQAARAEAETASRAKSQFLANMSHELRTPINAVVGYADLLQLGVHGTLSDGQRDPLARIKSSGLHLLAMVEDVLDLARVDVSDIRVAHDRVAVQPLAEAALSEVAAQARERGVEMGDEEACPPAAAFLGDEERVFQILVNLLSNAVKFTPPGGRVWVRCLADSTPPEGAGPAGEGPWTRIEVHDTGIGVADADRERIFSPFVQVDDSHTRQAGGSGLGLAIGRTLARLMGGDLTLAAREGGGSVFTLWLPAPGAAEGVGWLVPGGAAGLAAVGREMENHVEPLADAFVDALQGDPALPQARAMDRTTLQDHTPTLLLEIAGALVMVDEGCGRPEILRDSESILQVVSRLHGQQRARLGWSEQDLRREHEVLAGVVSAFVRDEAARRADADPERPLAIIRRLLERAERTSTESHARAAISERLVAESGG